MRRAGVQMDTPGQFANSTAPILAPLLNAF